MKEEEEEEEGERRIKPKHPLLHAVAGKENKQKTTEEEGRRAHARTYKHLYIHIVYIYTEYMCTHTHTEIWRLVGNECGADRLTERARWRERGRTTGQNIQKGRHSTNVDFEQKEEGRDTDDTQNRQTHLLDR